MKRRIFQLGCASLSCGGILAEEPAYSIRAQNALDAIRYLQWGLLAVLGIFCLLALLGVARRIGKGELPGIRGHWGGFGDVGRGWTMSAPLTYLIVAVCFGALFSTVGIYGMRSLADLVAPAKQDASEAGGKVKPAAKALTEKTQEPAQKLVPTNGPVR